MQRVTTWKVEHSDIAPIIGDAEMLQLTSDYGFKSVKGDDTANVADWTFFREYSNLQEAEDITKAPKDITSFAITSNSKKQQAQATTKAQVSTSHLNDMFSSVAQSKFSQYF